MYFEVRNIQKNAQKTLSFYINNKHIHNNVEKINNLLIFWLKLGKIPVD